jgi:hypothetical protein
VTYRTSQIMANSVAETVNTFRNMPILGVFYGRGLIQALIREANLPNACTAEQTEKRAWMAAQRVNVVDAPLVPKGRGSVWEAFVERLTPDDLPALVGHIAECEPRRAAARYNTGTVPFETSVLLRAVTRYYQPRVVAEVGTFIGTSARALDTGATVYTCDRSNDCLPATATIRTYPYQSSTDMLRAITEPVDLFFLDGRLQPADLHEIDRLGHPRTVFLFDDCVGEEKGVVNLRLLAPRCPDHVAIPPCETYKGRSTLGALLPRMSA